MKKINVEDVKLEYRPDGPHPELPWYYSWGNFSGWSGTEKEADAQITNAIKRATKRKNK